MTATQRTTRAVTLLFCSLLLSGTSVTYAQAPALDPAKDADHLGPADLSDVLFWTPEQQVAGYRNMDKVFPTRRIIAGDSPLALPKDLADLGGVRIQSEEIVLTTDEYFTRQSVAGLLVIKDGVIVYERYGLGNTENSRWISFSVAKSVTSVLVGAAIRDGFIKSVDEIVTDYLPRLKESSYDLVTIRDLLQMASGVQWNEDYADPNSDVSSANWETLSLYENLRQKPRVAESGEVFNYNTAETNLVGTLLRSAIGNNLTTYLTDKIWQPFGMESDAFWGLPEPGDGEFGGCCISATLRDYGRIGLFVLNEGRLADGTQVIPENWMKESITPSKGFGGYGYLWWLLGDGSFRATGIFGQGIYINPKERVVVALHSARPVASEDSDWALQFALFAALTDALRD